MSVAVYRAAGGAGRRRRRSSPGHSLGEYSAHRGGGHAAFADAVRLVRNRGRYMQEAVPVGAGAMARSLASTRPTVNQACEEAAQGEVVSAANLNGAGQIVIAGTAAAVARASARAKALGARRAIPLPVSAPFHCALMRPAEVRLTPELRSVPTADPRIPVIANVDAQPKRTAAASIDALIKQIASPVRWEDVVERLASEGVTRYVEVGPGKALSGMIKRIARPALGRRRRGRRDRGVGRRQGDGGRRLVREDRLRGRRGKRPWPGTSRASRTARGPRGRPGSYLRRRSPPRRRSGPWRRRSSPPGRRGRWPRRAPARPARARAIAATAPPPPRAARRDARAAGRTARRGEPPPAPAPAAPPPATTAPPPAIDRAAAEHRAEDRALEPDRGTTGRTIASAARWRRTSRSNAAHAGQRSRCPRTTPRRGSARVRDDRSRRISAQGVSRAVRARSRPSRAWKTSALTFSRRHRQRLRDLGVRSSRPSRRGRARRFWSSGRRCRSASRSRRSARRWTASARPGSTCRRPRSSSAASCVRRARRTGRSGCARSCTATA